MQHRRMAPRTQTESDADALARAIAVHRQHLTAARRAIAANDNGAVRELLTELLTERRAAPVLPTA